MQLPENLYTAEQSRQLDQLAIDNHGLGDGILMQRAGKAACDLLRHRWPRARAITIICGPGNNGGDGYVLASLARSEGLTVSVLCLGDLSKQHGDALKARQTYEKHGGEVTAYTGELPSGQDVVVDALFGTGIEREAQGLWAQAIEAINNSALPVLSLDIASGLHADSGRVLGCAVRASATISFICLKAGMFTADGPDCCGHISFENLGVPPSVTDSVAPFARRISRNRLASLLPRRRRNTHKGESGRVLLIGGGPGMSGAVRLAAEAVLYSGAGLVTVATCPEHAAHISAARPELIVCGVSSADQLRSLIKTVDVIAIGPGLGCTDWARQLMATVMEADSPRVLDADALNLLAQDAASNNNWILTPHPGEAATLLGSTSGAIQQNRFVAADEVVQRFGGVCVLKGAGTVIADGRARLVCDCGNPALSTAGSGDLLTGVIASFLAQGLEPIDAAAAAVWVHGHAADMLATEGQRGWLASDFLPLIRDAVHQLERAP